METVDFEAIKERQRMGWEAGDYPRVGNTLQIIAEHLVEAADVRVRIAFSTVNDALGACPDAASNRSQSVGCTLDIAGSDSQQVGAGSLTSAELSTTPDVREEDSMMKRTASGGIRSGLMVMLFSDMCGVTLVWSSIGYNAGHEMRYASPG